MPFGTMRAHTGTNVSDYKFTDQELDTSTNLYNYKARLYDPVIGRFISPDSRVQAPFDPQTLNRYSYCRNNPLIYIDPTGHWYDGFSYGDFDWSSYDWGSDGDSDGLAQKASNLIVTALKYITNLVSRNPLAALLDAVEDSSKLENKSLENTQNFFKTAEETAKNNRALAEQALQTAKDACKESALQNPEWTSKDWLDCDNKAEAEFDKNIEENVKDLEEKAKEVQFLFIFTDK